METFETLLRWTHIVFGFAGLSAFWVPIVTRKGASTHVRFGRIFLYSAYGVLASAGVSVVYHLANYWRSGMDPASNANAFAFLIFLGYLAFVTFVTVRHGVGVLESKRNPNALHTRGNVWLARGSQLASVGLVVFALWFRPPALVILLALSPIGFLTGHGILEYVRSAPPSPRQWLYEHLGNMIGGGIAFHTAFAVFGANRLFDLNFGGLLGVLPWVLPAAIGLPATQIWIRHYKKKYGELGGRPAEAGL